MSSCSLFCSKTERSHQRASTTTPTCLVLSQRKKAYCAKHPKEGRCNAESITVANTYIRTVTGTLKCHPGSNQLQLTLKDEVADVFLFRRCVKGLTGYKMD